MGWAFLAALALLFWLPELILHMGWAKFWIQFTTQFFIWSLFGVSFNLLMGYAGMVSFRPGRLLGIGGYTAGLLLKNIAGLPFYIGLLAAPVGGALAALIIGYFCVRRTHIYFAILTLAFGHIIYLIAFKWYDFTGGDNGLIGIPVPAWIIEPTSANYYKFVLVICVAAIYLLWRIVNSPFGKTLTAIRENPERADFVGIPVDRYRLYAFVAGWRLLGPGRRADHDQRPQRLSRPGALDPVDAGAADGAAGRRLHVLRPVVGALLLRTMDADITQNYPEIWQLFLGGVLVLILFGLPGGIVGFIQERDIGSGDDTATRTGKLVRQFHRKSWMFFGAALAFATFFAVLHAPGAWLLPRAREFSLLVAGDLGHRALRAAATRRGCVAAVAAATARRSVQQVRRRAAAGPAGRHPCPARLSRHAAIGTADRSVVGRLHGLLAMPGGYQARLWHRPGGDGRQELTPCCYGSRRCRSGSAASSRFATSACRWIAGEQPASLARTAPGSRRCSISSPAICRRPAGRSSLATATSPATPAYDLPDGYRPFVPADQHLPSA